MTKQAVPAGRAASEECPEFLLPPIVHHLQMNKSPRTHPAHLLLADLRPEAQTPISYMLVLELVSFIDSALMSWAGGQMSWAATNKSSRAQYFSEQ